MDINREALILYLRDLRDLEIAKKKISKLYAQDKNRMQDQLCYMKTPNLKSSYTSIEPETFGLIGFGAVIMLLFGFLWWTPKIYSSIGIINSFLKFGYIVFKVFAIVGIIMFVGGVIRLILQIKSTISDKISDSEHNRNEKIRVESNADKIQKVQDEWIQWLKYLESEYNKVDSLLASYYSQNILASQYRNLPALIYIYDYMSTSQESFRDTLIHEHMENGIRKILDRLDTIISQNEVIIFNQHRLEAQNNKMVYQNQEMLGSLQRAEQNTLAAAQYGELAANYGKTVAFFAEANYLQKK